MLSDTLFEYKRYFIDGAESELRAQHNSSRRVSFLDGQMIGNARQDYKGVSARVRRGGLYGFSSKGNYTQESVAQHGFLFFAIAPPGCPLVKRLTIAQGQRHDTCELT